MSRWTWKTWLMAGIVGALFAAAGIVVAVGVATHEEPGLTSPDARWPDAPLLVSCELYGSADRGDTDRACATVWGVVRTVNSRLGIDRGMLSQNGDVGGAIHVTMRAPVEVGVDGPCGEPGECFELTGRAGVYEHCDVRTQSASGGASDLEWLVVYHGLGHCLGLAHDDYEQSIMRPTQRRTPDRVLPPWISDFDRGLLRDLYGGG